MKPHTAECIRINVCYVARISHLLKPARAAHVSLSVVIPNPKTTHVTDLPTGSVSTASSENTHAIVLLLSLRHILPIVLKSRWIWQRPHKRHENLKMTVGELNPAVSNSTSGVCQH